jgi:hypothetical protein
MFIEPPQVSSLDLLKYLENPIGLLFYTDAHKTFKTDHNGVPTFSRGIDSTLAIIGNQGQTILSNACLTLCIVVVVILVAIATQ